MTKTETETIEYKKSLAELKEGLISIVAILNKHKHGELWFGIRNDGKAVGVEANEKTLRDNGVGTTKEKPKNYQRNYGRNYGRNYD